MALLDNKTYKIYYQKIGLIYQKPEVKASLEVILSVFAVTLLIFAAIRPTIANVAALQKKIEDQASVNRKADIKISQLFKAQASLSEFASIIPLFNDAVPSRFDFYDVVRRIELTAKKNEVSLTSISLPGKVLYYTTSGRRDTIRENDPMWMQYNEEGILEMKTTIVAKGVQKSIMNFVYDLENLDHVALLSEVTINKLQTGEAGVLSLTTNATFYFIKPTQ